MTLDTLYGGTVEDRLRTAQFLHHHLTPHLEHTEQFSSLLAELVVRAERVNSHMRSMVLGPLCIRCSAGPSGGCCSLYMAGETDALQMLTNMAVGIDVQQVRDDGKECCFLGSEGCIFLCKPFFCLNYNCSHIHRAATREQMTELERLTGSLLSQQYKVEQYLLEVIRREKIFA